MTRREPRRRVTALLLAFGLLGCGGGDGRGAATTADASELGHPDSVLFWTPAQKLAGFPHYDRIFEVRRLRASPSPFPLARAMRDWSGLTYEVDGSTYDLEGFLRHNRVAGLLVVKSGAVVLEEYRLGHHESEPWVSYSVTKSVVSMLYGAALREGRFEGLDDAVTDHVPELLGTAYDGVSIGQLLHMASGVAWNEDYTDPSADVSAEIGMTSRERIAYYGSRPRAAPPGTRFNYSTGETHLAGVVLARAVGESLTEYLQSRIWTPFGMEHDAHWRLVEPEGAEHGGCCLSATLRDYARIGLFALRDGRLSDGTPVLADGWMARSTSPSEGNPGYGALWWLASDGSYSARGIFGQGILIDPAEETVVAIHGAWSDPVSAELSAHRDALIEAVQGELAPGR